MLSPFWRLLATLPFAVLLILHAWYYLPFLSDDALISMRYSQRLVEGHGLTWTAGIPVEGYSNLLWVLLMALPHALGADLVLTARVLGILCTLLVLFSLRPCGANRAWSANLGSWVSMGFVAVSAPMAIWAIGGLEQALAGGLLALSVALLFQILDGEARGRNTLTWLSLVLGLLCITRPDGPLFVVAAVLPLWLFSREGGARQGLSSVAVLLLGPFLLYGGQLVFRLAYYGDYVPNTARVKIAPSMHRLQDGWGYVQAGFSSLGLLGFVAVALVAAMSLRKGYRLHALFLGSALVLWNAYLAAIGGDLFPGHRHFVLNVVLLAFGLKWGLKGMQLEVRNVWLRRPVAAVLLLLFVPMGLGQFKHDKNKAAVEERWEWGGREVGLWLKQAFWESQPQVAVTAAGCIPFWSELPSLDMLGLNDHFLPRHKPEDFGEGALGHELGSAEYILDQEPDIIIFHTGVGPCFRVGNELSQSAQALEMYSPVSIKVDPTGAGTGGNALMFFHRFSVKVGMRPVDAGYVLPAHLFTELRSAAYFNGKGSIEVDMTSAQELKFHFTSKEGRNWQEASVHGADAALIRAQIEVQGDRVQVVLTTDSEQPVRFENVRIGY